MSLHAAQKMLEAEVASFGPGTPRAPKEGTADWWLLRSKALALSCLRRADQLALGYSPAQAERFFGACGRQFKQETDGDQTDTPG